MYTVPTLPQPQLLVSHMNHIVPRFTTRRSALTYLNWYYKQDWWKNTRLLVYHYHSGICCMCNQPIALEHGWAAHHETDAYNHLWHEDEYLYLMQLLHLNCHLILEEEKTRQRKKRNKERRRAARERVTVMKTKRKTLSFLKKAQEYTETPS